MQHNAVIMTCTPTGPPHTLCVKQNECVEIENNMPVSFEVEVRDRANNLTCQHKLFVLCKV